MNGFESSIVIHRPLEDVFGFLANLEHDASWRREWTASEKTSAGPMGVDATFRLTGKALGRPMVVTYVTTEYEPNRTAAWKTLSGPFPLLFRRSFQPEAGGTRVDFRYEAENPGVLLRLLRPLVVRMGRRQLVGDFPKLVELLAGGDSLNTAPASLRS